MSENYSALDLEPGNIVGGYTLLGRLDQGGMGAIWRVRDDGGNIYAMKILLDSLKEDSDGDDSEQLTARERFRREALALQRIDHPGVNHIVDMELDDALAFIVTELIDGKNLRDDVYENGRYTAEDLEQLARMLINAVDAVHAAGIIHRDIKPTNVMISKSGPVLVDFGISMGENESHVTRTGLVMGTPGFIAPEIIEGAESDEATDWWSVASVIGFAATGKPIFGSKPLMTVLEREASGNADLSGLPPLTLNALRQALHPDRMQRCSAQELLAAIAQEAQTPEIWDNGEAEEPIASTTVLPSSSSPSTVAMSHTSPSTHTEGDEGKVVRPFGESFSLGTDAHTAVCPALGGILGTSDGQTQILPTDTSIYAHSATNDGAEEIAPTQVQPAVTSILPAVQPGPTAHIDDWPVAQTTVMPAVQPAPAYAPPTQETQADSANPNSTLESATAAALAPPSKPTQIYSWIVGLTSSTLAAYYPIFALAFLLVVVIAASLRGHRILARQRNPQVKPLALNLALPWHIVTSLLTTFAYAIALMAVLIVGNIAGISLVYLANSSRILVNVIQLFPLINTISLFIGWLIFLKQPGSKAYKEGITAKLTMKPGTQLIIEAAWMLFTALAVYLAFTQSSGVSWQPLPDIQSLILNYVSAVLH